MVPTYKQLVNYSEIMVYSVVYVLNVLLVEKGKCNYAVLKYDVNFICHILITYNEMLYLSIKHNYTLLHNWHLYIALIQHSFSKLRKQLLVFLFLYTLYKFKFYFFDNLKSWFESYLILFGLCLWVLHIFKNLKILMYNY